MLATTLVPLVLIIMIPIFSLILVIILIFACNYVGSTCQRKVPELWRGDCDITAARTLAIL